MKRFRRLRKRRAALALAPATVALTIIAGTGAALGAQAETSSIDANKAKVKPGAKVKVRGRFPARVQTQAGGAPQSTRRVVIKFRAAGKNKNWHRAKTTLSDRDGRYVEKVKVRRTGYLRAVHADGRRSERVRVRVKSRVSSKLKRRHAKLGQSVPVKGKVKPTFSRRQVVVRIGGDRIKTRTNRKGKFKVRWRADRTGTFKAKVKAKGDRIAAGNGDKAGRTTVYRPAQASWYGPGFYGNRTACGQTLTTGTVGVAHKTMPCGTKLKLRYGNNTVKVKVIDRGPYHGNREFDLTGATKQKLGFGSTGTVWASR